MIKRTLSKSIAENTPYEIWNAFIDLIATEDYKGLIQIQRIAHLVFWYDAELQNGGHLQYFENRGTDLLEDTLAALKEISAIDQHKVLTKAGNLWLSMHREKIKTAAEYVDTALEGEFDELDSQYYECTPSINDLLGVVLKSNRDSFVEII